MTNRTISPLFSFVLPAYKGRFLDTAIQSILSQTERNFELIIVNDASPDDIDSIISEYDDPRIKYYKNEYNIGGQNLVLQWNHSVSYSSGEYIILASDDDIYAPNFLEQIKELAIKYPAISVLRSMIQTIDSTGSIISQESFEVGDLIEYETYLKMYGEGIIGSGIPQYAFKASALREIGGFVEYPLAWFSDDATVAKLARRGNGIALTKQILFSFRVWDGSITGNKRQTLDQFRQKALAASLFVHSLSQTNTTNRIITRAKNLTSWQIYDLNFLDSIRGVRYLYKIDPKLFNFMWCAKKITGYVKYRILKSLNQ